MKDNSSFDYFFDQEHPSPYLEIPVEGESELIGEIGHQELLELFDKKESELVNDNSEYQFESHQTSNIPLLQLEKPPDEKAPNDEAAKLRDLIKIFGSQNTKAGKLLTILALQKYRLLPGYKNTPKNRRIINFRLGKINLELRRVATAAYYFEIFLNEFPDNETALELQREIKRRLGRLPKKARNNSRSKRRVATEIYRLKNKGKRYFIKKNYIKAIYYFERSRQGMVLNNWDKELVSGLFFNIGFSNFLLARFSTAITYLEKYIEIKNPEKDHKSRKYLKYSKFAIGIIE